MIYFDNAASSFPKPQEVIEAVTKGIIEVGANPGRSGHLLARQAANYISETRELAADIFNCTDPRKVIFSNNATGALNQAIMGLEWSRGDHVISTSLEHNSVRRPLESLKADKGIRVDYIDYRNETDFLAKLENNITSKTRLIAITHGSNITGHVLPIREIANIAHQYGVIILVDGSQTAGHIPINMVEDDIDMLAIPGHKGLLGPQGTGMLLIQGDIKLKPLLSGGTGSMSELPHQPESYPEALEAGTLNTPGIMGLQAALKLYKTDIDENVPRETILARSLADKLQFIKNVILYLPDKIELPIVAFNIKGVSSQEIAMILDSHYNIAVRAGLHCSPLTHEMLDTIDDGIVRVSMGPYNTEEEVNTFINAIKEIVSAYDEL